jgi:hypothetical protein
MLHRTICNKHNLVKVKAITSELNEEERCKQNINACSRTYTHSKVMLAKLHIELHVSIREPKLSSTK